MTDYTFIEKKTGKTLTESELGLLLYKEGENIVWCDIQGVAKMDSWDAMKEPTIDYYLLDECGNAVFIDPARFTIIEGKHE